MANNDENMGNGFKKCKSKNGTPDEIRNRVMTDDYEDCYRNLDPSELTKIAKIVFSTNASTMTNEQTTKLNAHQALLKDVLNETFPSELVRQLIKEASKKSTLHVESVGPVTRSSASTAPVSTAPASTAPASTVKVAPVASNVTRKAVSKPSFFNQQKIARNARVKAAANAAKAAANDEEAPPPAPQVNTQANEDDVIPPPPVNTQAIEYARQKANQIAKAAKQREQEVEGARAALAAAQNDIEKRKKALGIISATEANLAHGKPKKTQNIITAELAVKKAEQAKIAAEQQLAQAELKQRNAQRREKDALAKFKQLAPVEVKPVATNSKLIRITRDENGIFHKEIVHGSSPQSIPGESRLFRLTREGGTYKIEQVPLLTRNIPPLTRNPLYNRPVNTAYSYKGSRRTHNTKKRK